MKWNKLVVIAFMPFFLFFPCIALSQEKDDSVSKAVDRLLGQWKRNYASPSYGIALFNAEIRQRSLPGIASAFAGDEFLIPAADLRIFRGVNVSKRGGFYTGIETGVYIFLPLEKTYEDDVIIDDVLEGGALLSGPYGFNVQAYGGVVFLLAKYGMRLDMGPAVGGLSAGVELGAGTSIYTGGFDIYIGEKENPSYEANSGSNETQINLLVETSVEAAIRMGKNFRFFAKGTVGLVPLLFENDQFIYFPINNGQPDGIPELFRYALNNYEIELKPFVYDLRVGFILNFD